MEYWGGKRNKVVELWSNGTENTQLYITPILQYSNVT